MTRKSIVVAHGENRAIGHEGDMPWGRGLPSDLERFKELTTGSAIIMGRKTYDSIGRPLPERKNIVVTKQQDLEISGCHVVHSIEEAYAAGTDVDELFIIGGASIYHLTMQDVDTLYITIVHDVFEGDTYFPEISEDEWKQVSTEFKPADVNNKYDYSFVCYERKE